MEQFVMNRVKSLTLTQLFCGARLFSICIDFEFDFEFFFSERRICYSLLQQF